MSSDLFLNPQPRADRLFDYKLRRDILSSIQRELPNFSGTLLDIGCGKMPYKSILTDPPSRVSRYIGLDIEDGVHGVKPDLTFDGSRIPLEDNSVETVIATEVLEHCEAPGDLLREIQRVLTPGGIFFCTVPCFWPLHEVPRDYSRFTPYSLAHHLGQAGFKDIRIQGHGGWDASLAQMIGLWLRFRGMRPWKRQLLSRIFQPLVLLLNCIDTPPMADYGESTMMTGLSGTARK